MGFYADSVILLFVPLKLKFETVKPVYIGDFTIKILAAFKCILLLQLDHSDHLNP